MIPRSLALPVPVVLLLVFFTSLAQAGERPRISKGGDMVYGGSPDLAKAGADTINLMATRSDPTNGPGEPFYFGDFESAAGVPDWNGWTHWDATQPTVSHWQVSNYNQPDPANHAAWCGDISFAACDTSDVAGGYGNSWHDLIEFRQTVPFPAVESMVKVTATVIMDTEPGYDYVYLSYRYKEQPYADLWVEDGDGTVAVSDSVTYQPSDYLDGTDIAVYFRFTSDGAWSDDDCKWPTAGACQIDDINVRLVNAGYTEDFFEDFEHGGVADDFGLWNIAFPPGVGDFAQIWSGLDDLDPCVTNTTPQVAFIDDGIVIPGTGGTQCLSWCYGPGGYIVNTLGGLAGPREHLLNPIESPVMTWPAPKNGTGPDYDGAVLSFTVYRHEDLSADAPGIFFIWAVRSADTDGSAGFGVQNIATQEWQDRNFVYFGGPDYHRKVEFATDLMNPGRDEVQIQLAPFEFGWIFHWNGNDGTPAPYFDNVTLKIFPHIGPAMSAREFDLAQDNFPESGTIDSNDPGSHSVRFDMGNNISLASHLRNDPGDSLVVDITARRTGAGLDGAPELHYIVDRNPVFDPYRTSGLPSVGSVAGQPAVGLAGTPTANKWAFDLPDTGFLFPGDVLHYFISATDAIGGEGGNDPRTALMPPDTTGFSTGFGDPLGYNSTFTVRALPSLEADFSHPGILFINDFANLGGEDEWHTALGNAGLLVGEGYDVYYVNGPSTGVGNGIGGRADSALLAGYDEILYTAGDLSLNTIANGDFNNDSGDDVGTLTGWLEIGGKDMFLTGDNLAYSLSFSGTAANQFLNDIMGVGIQQKDILPLIGNQTSPLVVATAANPVFNGGLQSWVAFGGCPGINTFDAVSVFGTGNRVAEFTDPVGVPGVYTYSAATLNAVVGQAGNSRVISLPYDLMNVYTDPAAPVHQVPGRALLLMDVLDYFGVVSGNDPSGVDDIPGIRFQASHYPNPFNPRATIKYSLPRAGHLKLSIFNVRGQLVKTLIDGPRPAGENQTVVWDGSDNLGTAAASGLYFYEARAAGEVKTGKMMLMK
ncbi:MAG: FlgD immunoglobulin-like domain containing protein [Candidatus Krumholzibacteriota bacterium]